MLDFLALKHSSPSYPYEKALNDLAQNGEMIGRRVGKSSILFYIPTAKLYPKLREVLTSEEFVRSHPFPGQHQFRVIQNSTLYLLAFKTTLVDTSCSGLPEENYEVSNISLDPLFIPKQLSIKNISFVLSTELRKGLQGGRAEDHEIDLQTLYRALEKKVGRILKTRKRAYDFYVCVMKNEGAKFLNLVIWARPEKDSSSRREFTVITAYYMPPISIKGRFKLDQAEFERWAAKCSFIDLSE